MNINRVCVNNFLAFAGRVDETFIDGINVFIGENGIGKTTLLKCIYAACEAGKKNFEGYFSTQKHEHEFGAIQIFSGENEFRYGAYDGEGGDLNKWTDLKFNSVYIPSAEMLSHSKGLLAMASKYEVPFDNTQIDILVDAQLWETKEISERNQKLLSLIGGAIDGEVVYENDTFYIVKTNGLKVEFALESDGFKKLGLLWKLVRNGLLESGSILLWDEPEASLNPEQIPLVAEVLHILANDGVQIFIATHTYVFIKYLDIKKKNEDDVLFISLYREGKETKTSRAFSYSLLKNNSIEESEDKLFKAVMRKALEN